MSDLKRSHTQDELMSIYKDLKYPMEYFERFKAKYNETYAEWYNEMKDYNESEFDEDETIGNTALEFSTLSYIKRFVAEKEKGHSDEWADSMARDADYEYDYEGVIEETYSTLWKINTELAKKGIHLHCKSLNGDELFNKHYLYLFENLWCGKKNCLSVAKNYSTIYKQEKEKGKSDVYAHHYANLEAIGEFAELYCRYYAYAYDKAISEGKSKVYAGLFAEMYGDGAANYGEREEKNIPEFWEEKVFAYMNGWEYAMEKDLSSDFIKTYENVYLNSIHSDHPETIPYNRLEEYVLEEALKKYNQNQ